MTTKPAAIPKPIPTPSEVTQFYWDGAKEHRLMIQRCNDCANYIHPPMVMCPKCQSMNLGASQVSGKGAVYTYTVVERMFHPGFADDMPYVLALVDLPEQHDLRLLTNILECPLDQLAIGMDVEVTFEEREGYTAPQFRPAG